VHGQGFTTAIGEFRIDPPLTYAEFKDSPYRPEKEPAEPEVLFNVETTEVDGPDGVMLLRRAVTVRPYSPGRPFAYHHDLVQALQYLLDVHGETHTFTGYFECRESANDVPGDWWRLVVRGREAVRIEPTVAWSED
jgi:hypothetical protein